MDLLSRYACLALILAVVIRSADAIEIVVDYSFDTQNFFDTEEKRNTLQAAADRYSRVITSSLLAVAPDDSERGWRVGFNHPGTGSQIQLSSAESAATDPLSSSVADVYNFSGLVEDQWILFAGGRPLVSAGLGGTATGVNFSMTFDDVNGPLHRGLIPNTPVNSANDLPVWGGSIAFNSNLSWHFGLDTVAAPTDIDFYSIALHEIGHALGLNTGWNQWEQHVDGATYVGTSALAAYNEDNQDGLAALQMESAQNTHWREGSYDSFIFSLGQPQLVGTVGSDALQDLLMEPIANFTPSVSRFELTNVDAAALVDIGWSILEEGAGLDVTGDGVVDSADVDVACGGGADLTPYFSALASRPGDVNLDGAVQFADFLIMSANFSGAGDYSDGDLNCDGHVLFADFLILSANFGQSAADARAIPEPGGIWLMLVGVLASGALRRKCGSRPRRR